MGLVSRAVAVCAFVLLALAAPAAAGPPGDWTRVTGIGEPDSNTLEVGLVRPTTTSPLNVLWTRDNTVFNTQILDYDANVSDPHTVFAYNRGVSNEVQLLGTPEGGLRAFFGGLFDTNDHPLTVGMATATSADGVSWDVQPTLASDSRTGMRSRVYVAAGIGGTIATNGVPISIWGDSAPGEGGYHVGTSDQDPDVHFGGSSATVAYPNAATDRVTGQVVIAWNDLESDRVLVQSIFPAGPRMNTPGGQAPDSLERVAMTGRGITAAFPDVDPRPGIYIAYLRGTNKFLGRPAVWRVGANRPAVLSSKRGARFVGVTPTGDGRLWAFWARRPRTAWRLYARRSNYKATKWGATVAIKPPAGTDAVHSLEGEGHGYANTLDLLALVQRSQNDLGNWHQRVRAGLTLLAKVLGDGKVEFTVLDAGQPLQIKVEFGGKSEFTNANGKVTMSAEPGRRIARTGGGAGYHLAERVVRVK